MSAGFFCVCRFRCPPPGRQLRAAPKRGILLAESAIFRHGAHNGILREDADETISCVGRIGKDGMRETDREIIRLMLQ